MRKAATIALLPLLLSACKGSDSSVKIEKSSFDPGLSAVPGDLPDKAPPDKIGDAWTVYGLWRVTQDPNLQEQVASTEITVKGHVVYVTAASEDRNQANVTPHVWIADQPSRKGLYFTLTGYADSYSAMEHAAAYDRCIAACSAAKGDPRTEAAGNPGRYSRIFGDCLADVKECRDLYEADRRANFHELIGNLFKWYVRDQVFGSDKRKAIEEELRGNGNIVCEAGPAQRRILVTAMVASLLGVDIDAYQKEVMDEIKARYPGQKPEQLEPSILQGISNSKLSALDIPENNRKLWEAIRAMRDGSNDGAALLDLRGLGAELRAAIAKSEGAGLQKVADELFFDILIRWFYSKSDTGRDANMACVFDDLINFTSSYNLDPLDLITRDRAMLGPVPGTTWEEAMASGQSYELRAEFVSQSRTGFLGWVLDVDMETVCAQEGNCPQAINPVLGTVYDFGFTEE